MYKNKINFGKTRKGSIQAEEFYSNKRNIIIQI